MDQQRLSIQLTSVLQSRDVSTVREFLLSHPNFLALADTRSRLMDYSCLSWETPDLAQLLYELGLDINTPNRFHRNEFPIYTAARMDRWPTVAWLIEHGAIINLSHQNDAPFCLTLSIAAQRGPIEIVRQLVEAGAVLDICDYRNKTPLDWATDAGRNDVIGYLTSRGAIPGHRAVNYRPPVPLTPVTQHIEAFLCEPTPFAWNPIVPSVHPVRLGVVMHEEFCGLFTDGMSDRPMGVPLGKERYRFAELAMPIGDSWPAETERWGEEPYAWAIQWLLRIADYPFEIDTWLGDPSCVIANGEPPEALSPYTSMTCWLLLVDKDPFTSLARDDETEVVFYTVIPIHTSERDFEREHGLRALLERFAEREIPPNLEPNRPAAV